jgi:hypothetical protein
VFVLILIGVTIGSCAEDAPLVAGPDPVSPNLVRSPAPVGVTRADLTNHWSASLFYPFSFDYPWDWEQAPPLKGDDQGYISLGSRASRTGMTFMGPTLSSGDLDPDFGECEHEATTIDGMAATRYECVDPDVWSESPDERFTLRGIFYRVDLGNEVLDLSFVGPEESFDEPSVEAIVATFQFEGPFFG